MLQQAIDRREKDNEKFQRERTVLETEIRKKERQLKKRSESAESIRNAEGACGVSLSRDWSD